ncbi:MaoC family dehydratase [Actinoplanes bogorensis]|uniref:MaoC family dehydratase n=1 Tax=Paractinoplanes bogorensis TaxID=1610840 RepID=A0ABS5YUQ6_9ACTN|nr:MaoC family dehydratase [Actinoplanes bogorensis]MBU2667187.1 MaoC family dehydratase [Actinoplanes bogorensis]
MRHVDLTGRGNYFEDFTVGQRLRHIRGRTVTNEDNMRWTLRTLNTAQAHFNLEYATGMLDGIFPERLVMGGATLALVVGMTSEDLAEQTVRELGYDDIRLTAPVFQGDTLWAESEVLELTGLDDEPGAGTLTYRFRGWKGTDTTVATGTRRIVVRRRPAGAGKESS